MKKIKIPQLTTKQKFLLGLAIIGILVVILLIILRIPQGGSPAFTETVPVIPSTSTTSETEFAIIDPVRVLNPEQKIVFNWNNISPAIPKSMSIYSINIPIINDVTVSNMIDKLGFTSQDIQPGTTNSELQLINNNGSLFSTTKLNHLSYSSTLGLPEHNSNISSSEAVKKAQEIATTLFGNYFASTLVDSPKVTYFLHSSENVESEPKIVSMETANVILISFNQKVNEFPVVSMSRQGEVLSITIDTTNKLYSLYLSGGYQKIVENKKSPTISFDALKANAPKSSMRISQSTDMAAESGYTDAKVITIDVKSVNLGYFQYNNYSLSPVFIIRGDMSAKGLRNQEGIYIVPATTE